MSPTEVRQALSTGLYTIQGWTDVDELDLAGMDPLTQARIRRESGRALGGLTIDAALERLAPADRERLAEWLAAACGIRARGVDPREIPRDAEPLRAWASARGLAWALASESTLSGWYAKGLTVAQSITQPSVPENLRRAALAWLTEVAARAPRLAEREAGRHRDYAVDPGAPFSALWSAAWPRYQELWAAGPMTLFPSREPQVTASPPVVVAQLPGGPVEIWLDRPLPLQGDRDVDLAVLSVLLQVICTPGPTRDVLGEVYAMPGWRRELARLEEAMRPLAEGEPSHPEHVWELDADAHGLILWPCHGRLTKTGRWMTQRFHHAEAPWREGLEALDRAVARRLAAGFDRPSPDAVGEALELLAGHPRVVRRGRGAQEALQVRAGELQLQVDLHEGALVFGFTCAGRALARGELLEALTEARHLGGRAVILREGEVIVARCGVDVRELVARVAQLHERYPVDALPVLLDLLPGLQARLPVRFSPALRGQRLEGDPRPVLQVHMERSSLVLRVRVKPLPDAPEQLPGEGPATLHVARNGAAAWVERALGAEPELARQLLATLGVPESARQQGYTWAIDDPDAALEVLRAVHAHGFRVEVDPSIPKVIDATTRQLDLVLQSTSSGTPWFSLGGELRLAGGALSLGSVLAALRAGRRFVPLDDGLFVRLTDTLLARLAALDREGGGEPELTAVHAPLLAAIEAEGGTVRGSSAWREVSRRLASAQRAEIPLPEGLQAALRPYQREGFTWLARQAEWATGSVLADDMGLGKTVQAIALLLRRAERGPAMVVAPMSLLFNWEAELARFGPSLRVRTYHGDGRARHLDGLGPGDLLLTTYGVLLRDAEPLAALDLATTVLDEAQALKSAESQRTLAARGLRSGFTLALSGTPVENHSVELWSLFSVVAPGLFGSLPAFRRRFAQGPDEEARKGLAEMAGSFMLRRTKAQVAPELPEKVEVLHALELDPGHRALYAREVERSRARVARESWPKARFVVGQELMRLRQLACEPRMVDPDSPHEGPKVRWVCHSLREVVGRGAQALVFSSFVRLLERVRPELEASGMRIAWLTGSTPPGEREREVARFQRGEADVFLVSLKAGGTGLNLTAASYVFILDPWFNPAAEDQAADRAHRIGQRQTVTVYRGVARDTVEEEIQRLQSHKRKLVDDLMSGSGDAEVLSPEELLRILAGKAPRG